MARTMSEMLTDVADLSADYDETDGEIVRDIGHRLYELLIEMADWVIENTPERPTT